MPLHLAAPTQISSSRIGRQRLLLIWEMEVGVGGKVLTGKENVVHLLETGNNWGVKASCLCSIDENSQLGFFCILDSEYYPLDIWSCCPDT